MKKFFTVRMVELALMGVICLLMGMATHKYMADNVVKDMQVTAVTMNYGFYNVFGEFDWNPEGLKKYQEPTWDDL